MCDREAIHSRDDDLGYDNLAINDYSPTPVNIKLIMVQPRSADTEILPISNSSNECTMKKKETMAKRSSSSESIEEVDISQGAVLSNCSTKYYVVDYDNQKRHGRSTLSEENLISKYDQDELEERQSISVFDEEIMASDLIKNPIIGIHIHDLKADLHKFLLTPPPKNVLMTCQINKTNDIDKTLLFTNFIFSLQMFLPDSSSIRELEVLMVAHSNKNPKNFAYNISSDPSEVNFNSEAVIGQLKSNFLGKRFNIFSKTQSVMSNNGSHFNDSDDDNLDANISLKNDLHHIGVIFYKSSHFASKKPRKIDVAIPSWDDNKENYKTDTNLPKERKQMEEANENSFIRLENVEPHFDEDRKCYTLDFGGRAKLVSVKNFALTMKVDGKPKRVYQFGKCKTHYIVDFTYPLCPFQAFAIGLSSCQRKFGSE